MQNKITEENKASEPVNSKKSAMAKQLKYGSMSMIILILVVAIVVVINIMVSVMDKRTPMKIDLTPDKRYDLSDETIDVLKGLDKDVEILITMPRTTFTDMSAYY
ncbi:MAG: hypothetical protein II656_06325, partial [Ruminococcus sp.]|nr:hypothetical protein [Ruminococcus sp.]